MRKLSAWILVAGFAAGLLLGVPARVAASDHADPMTLKDPESNLTGLFCFPKDGRMILVLNIRRALTGAQPYDLTPFEYAIRIDLHSKVTFDDPSQKARYGGTVVSPEGIKEDAVIAFHLNPDTSVKSVTYTGLKHTDDIRVFTGVRDDPFIFPRFFKKNVISMVLSLPMDAFPDGQQDFILWGTAFKGDKQIDIVGRSNRTQQARFDFMNTLPPSQHVSELMRVNETRNKAYTWLNKYRQTQPLAGAIQLLFLARKYDFVPDVMIYSTRFPVGFPNGRQLTDDVAAETCATGDCVLQEVSYIEGGWPRAVVNDKPFLDDFPYLAEPFPDSPQAPNPPSILTSPLVDLVLLIVVLWLLSPIVLIWWGIRHWWRSRVTAG
jgi:hypothetical protein